MQKMLKLQKCKHAKNKRERPKPENNWKPFFDVQPWIVEGPADFVFYTGCVCPLPLTQFILHIVSKLFTSLCIMYIVYCTLFTVYFKLYTIKCILYTVCHTPFTLNCILYTVCCTLYTAHCILHTVCVALCAAHCILHTVCVTLYASHCILKTV